MATSWERLVATGFDLLPGFVGDVKLPKVAEFVVVVILASKDVHPSRLAHSRVRISDAWHITAFGNLFPADFVSVFGANVSIIYS